MSIIKVLHVAQAAGGVACYLSMLLKYMDRTNISNILVCSQDYVLSEFAPLVDAIEQLNIEREINLNKDLQIIKKLRFLIKKYQPDIIYLHSSKAGALGRIAAVGLKVKIVYNAHGWAFNMKCSYLKCLLYQLIEKILAYETDSIVAISNYEKLSAISHHITSSSKIKVIFNGIDLEKINMDISSSLISRASLNIPNESYIVGMVGRIAPQKAPEVFVNMSILIKKKIPNAFFIIVGDGEERHLIEKQLSYAGLTDCFFITGWVKNPIDYIQLFDQAVLLSRWEGFGLVLAEYMASGKPIVATEVDAIPELIIDGENGLLVNVDDYKQAADAVVKLYNNMDLRQKLISHAELRVKACFDIKRVAMEHIKLFSKLIVQ